MIVATGGWCPEGRKAEDGAIPDKYAVKELHGADYKQPTIKNVIDSDGSVVIYFGFLSGGTEQTVAVCIRNKKPYLLIDAHGLSIISISLHFTLNRWLLCFVQQLQTKMVYGKRAALVS